MFLGLLLRLLCGREARELTWNQQRREKRLGYVAEHCRICRKILPFEVLELRRATHYLFVPVERGRPMGHAYICSGCNTESSCYPAQFTKICSSAKGTIEELIAQTHPAVVEKDKDLLSAEALLTSSIEALPEKLRRNFLRESFSLAEPHFRHGYGHHGWHILKVALRPLHPTAEEIHAGLQPYQDARNRMGRLVNPEELLAAIYPELEKKDPNKFSY